MNKSQPHDFIFIRGVPIATEEVAMMEQKVGGMLFDESNFEHRSQKEACANVIVSLDIALRQYLERYDDYPDRIDIGDAGWLYVPVLLFAPDENQTIITPQTKQRPAGLVAWFRYKKIYRGANLGRKRFRLNGRH